MAHFAQLDENNFVTQVIVVHNNELLDESGVEQESKGIAFCQSLLGGNWVQTSYNNNFRKNYAGIGFTYDSNKEDRKSTRLNSSHVSESRMPSSA